MIKKNIAIAFGVLILVSAMLFFNKYGHIDDEQYNPIEESGINIYDKNYKNYHETIDDFNDELDQVEYELLDFENNNFCVLLPKTLVSEKNIYISNDKYKIENDEYSFIIYNEENEFLDGYEFVLKDDHLLPYGDYEFGKEIFGEDYYGDFSYELTKDGTMVAKAAVLRNNDTEFGYKIRIINPDNSSVETIEFLRPVTEEEFYARNGYFFQFDEELLNFAYAFTYDGTGKVKTDKEMKEITELRKKIQTEIILMETCEKPLTDMVEEKQELAFEEYVAFLEYWGSFENDAFEMAYEAGYKPSK